MLGGRACEPIDAWRCSPDECQTNRILPGTRGHSAGARARGVSSELPGERLVGPPSSPPSSSHSLVVPEYSKRVFCVIEFYSNPSSHSLFSCIKIHYYYYYIE